MTHVEPQIPDMARYSVGKAAEALGISRVTLWYKTEEGLIKCGMRRGTKRVRRFYSGAELKRFWRAQV